LFHVVRVFNRRNSRYISSAKTSDVPANVKHVFTTEHPTKVMVLGVVSSDGQKCPPVFIPQNDKVTTDKYIDPLTKHVLPWIWRTYPNGHYM
jgi:hypothetical protein